MNGGDRYNRLYPLALDITINLSLEESEQNLLMVKLNKSIDNVVTKFKIWAISDIYYIPRVDKLESGLLLTINILTNSSVLVDTLKFIKTNNGFKFIDSADTAKAPISNNGQFVLL